MKLIKGVNDLQTMRPDIAEIWHPTKNNVKPNEIYYLSTKEIWFLYPYDDPKTKKHFDFEWKQQLCYRVKSKNICPYLSKPLTQGYIYPGFNDLYTRHKELIDSEWDWNKNTISPSEILDSSNYLAWWNCKELGHHYQQAVKRRINNKFCPECAKTLKVSFPEKAVFFYIKKFFPDAIANYKGLFDNSMEIDVFIPSLNIGIEFDGYNAHLNRQHFDNLKNKLCLKNNINLIRIREKNYKNKQLPKLKYIDGDHLYSVKCGVYKELATVISNIICKISKIHIEIDIKKDTNKILELCKSLFIANSIGNIHPELIKDWSPRNKISPFQISAQSNVPVWWQCSIDGYEWLKSPNQRIADKKGCPVCGKQLVVPGINDAATLEPRILPFWNDKEISPTEVGPRTTKKINLKCPTCEYEWYDSLAHVLANKHICQMCFKGKIIKHPHSGSRHTPIKAINIETNEEKIFSSIAEAGRELKIDSFAISKIFNGTKHRVSVGGYKFIKI